MTCIKVLENFVAPALMLICLYIVQIASNDAVCENLPILNNGELLLNGTGPPFRINESIRFECNKGFMSNLRNPQITCVLQGNILNWTDSEGMCKPVCDHLPLVNNGQLVLDGREPPFLLHENISYKCDEDFRSKQRIPQITCVLQGSSANWTETEGACQYIVISCHDPGFIENADRNGSLFTFPNSITYKCKEGYRMIGSPTKYCSRTGAWQPPKVPYCEAILCPALIDPQNGKVLMSNRRMNSVATYTCDRKYKLSGNTLRVCQIDGTWNGTNPLCEEITCPHPGTPKYGRILGIKKNNTFLATDIIIFKCNDESVHVTTTKCLESGEWSSRPPVCPHTNEPTTDTPETEASAKEKTNEPTTDTPETDASIKEITECVDPGKINHGNKAILGLHINSTVTYFCDEGYELRGKSTLLCLENGKWDLDKLPICVKPLGVPAIIGIVLGVVIFISLVIGAYLWYKYKLKGIRGYGKKSKALTADATDIDEITGLDRDRKQIPVTVL